ncbi:high frequency lysogenization protein HflD [Bacterioplanoides sp.]|uniref:high frequency lysogenization protein HflD n=1 Tax=Bacterioplanoides sp. TaxID=2066072 RepID=UPI003B0028B5
MTPEQPTLLHKNHEQAIALAAVFQVATLVEQLARSGDVPEETSLPLIESLFSQNPKYFGDIYGDASTRLTIGLKQLKAIAGKEPQGINPDITRYALSLLHLEKKLSKAPDMLNALGQGIQDAERQAHHFGIAHENTIASLAGLYKQTLSNLSFRIRVTGNPTYLQTNHTANRVRTLLLAGIRAAMLWRQVGGKRWQLLVSRGRYLKACDELLSGDIKR